jgi:MoaA/NifB/PqqE/SkfB family radical SAM enzyme
MRLATWVASVVQNRLGATPRPSWCTYLVTYRCNATCRMCDSWQLPPGEELTPAQVAAVFRKIGRLDVVRLSGGEPFLRPDLLEVAEAVLAEAQIGVLHITTNGSFRKRAVDLVERFSRPDRLRFMVSFDGVGATHDENRGKGVPFRRALETVRALAALRADCGLEVSANHTVISPQSLADNVALRHILGEFGVEVHSVLAYADSAMYGLSLHGAAADHLIVPQGYPLHPELAQADVIGFVQAELDRIGDYRDPLLRLGKRYYLNGLLARLHGERRPTPNPKCVALRSHIRLLPDGRVPVCQFNTKTIGSLRDQSWEEVWHAAAAAGERAWVDACPGCWAECEVLPNALFSGDILRAIQ